MARPWRRHSHRTGPLSTAALITDGGTLNKPGPRQAGPQLNRNVRRTENDGVALSAFDDKSTKPDVKDLKKTLGRSAVHWDDLVAHVTAKYAPLDETWIFSGANWGWSLRLKRKRRTVLYMTPCKGHFLVGFVLGEKAVSAARGSTLPRSTITIIDEAKKYAEGRGVRIEIKNKSNLAIAKKLAAIKMEH